MYGLAFDTTGAGCGIILFKGAEAIAKFERQMEFGQAEILMPEIKKLLETHQLVFADLSALFVCVGPGSFTGVRSSLAAAKMFSFAQPRLKIGGISAFDAYIQTFADADLAEINAVIIETRRDDFYVQLFDKHLQKITAPQALNYENLLSLLKDKGCLVSLVGDGVERFLNRPSSLCLHAIKMFDSLPIEALARAGLRQLVARKLNFPKPLYLRAPDVTLK